MKKYNYKKYTNIWGILLGKKTQLTAEGFISRAKSKTKIVLKINQEGFEKIIDGVPDRIMIAQVHCCY